MIVVVFLATLSLFLLVVAPEVHWFDGGELLAAAAGLGVSHPPGQPPHAMLGGLLTLLPLGPVPLRVGLASAVPAAALAAAAAALTRALGRTLLPPPAPRREGRDVEVAAGFVGVASVLPGLVAGQATRVEVYALSALLWVSALALLAAWDGRDGRRPVAAALLAGLGFSNHPMIGGFGALSLALWVAFGKGRPLRRPRLWAASAGAFLLGVASWAYVPLRGVAAPPLVWGEATTFDGLVAIATGRAYWMNLGGESTGLAGSLSAQVALLAAQMGWPTLLLALAGLVLLATRAPRAGAAAAVALASALAVMATARRFLPLNPDTQGKMAVLAVLVTCLAGVALVGAVGLGLRQRPVGPSAGAALRVWPAVGLVVSLALVPTALAPRPDYPLPETYALAALESAPPRALALVSQDHLAFPAMALQLVEGERPDVALAVVGLAGSRWHLEALRRDHPHLAVPLGPDGRARPVDAPGPLQERIAAALALGSAAAVPVVVEPAGELPGIPRERLGLALPWLALDLERDGPAPLLELADEEHDEHPARYRDGGSRIWRLVRLQRAAALAERGRARAAAATLVAAAGSPSAALGLAPLVASLPEREGRPLEASAPPLGQPFISEPDQPPAALALLLAAAGRPREAEGLLASLSSPRAGAARAAVDLESGAEVGDALETLAGLDPGDREEALAWLARREASRGRGAAATALVDALGEDRPGLAEPLVGVGVALGEAGETERAVEVLERAVRIDPGLGQAWSNLGVAQARLGRLDDARRSFARALEADPSDARSRSYLQALEAGEPPRR